LILHPEFSGPNYQVVEFLLSSKHQTYSDVFQSFEIAQHFLTMCGTDLKKIGRQEFVPAMEFQKRWCLHYLAAFRNIELNQVKFHQK